MSRFLALFTFLLLSILCNAFSPENPTDRRVLVLLDDFSIKSSHSLYLQSLESRGFQLDFKLADDPKIALQKYGQYLYDALILFSPTIDSLGGSLNAAAILDFVDSGHDLILAADASASDLIREIATECGVDFDEDQAAMVIDHTSFAVSDTEGDHTLIAGDNFIQSDVILGKEKIKAPVLFKGIGHSVNPANSLVVKILSASPSAYSANPKSKLSTPPTLTGSAISLVSVVQARNNARILISGSLSMFSNRFFRSGVQKAGSTIKILFDTIICRTWLEVYKRVKDMEVSKQDRKIRGPKSEGLCRSHMQTAQVYADMWKWVYRRLCTRPLCGSAYVARTLQKCLQVRLGFWGFSKSSVFLENPTRVQHQK